MPWYLAASYVCLVLVGALLWTVPMERLATMLWQQRGMEKLCTKRVQAMQAKIDELGERLELRDGQLFDYQKQVEGLRRDNEYLEREINKLRYNG